MLLLLLLLLLLPHCCCAEDWPWSVTVELTMRISLLWVHAAFSTWLLPRCYAVSAPSSVVFLNEVSNQKTKPTAGTRASEAFLYGYISLFKILNRQHPRGNSDFAPWDQNTSGTKMHASDFLLTTRTTASCCLTSMSRRSRHTLLSSVYPEGRRDTKK